MKAGHPPSVSPAEARICITAWEEARALIRRSIDTGEPAPEALMAALAHKVAPHLAPRPDVHRWEIVQALELVDGSFRRAIDRVRPIADSEGTA